MMFHQFFDDFVEYPLKRIMAPREILPLGTFWQYVSSQFAGAFLNVGELVGAYLIARYCSMDEIEEDGGDTKRQRLAAFIAGRDFHQRLDRFGEDIVILSECYDEDDRRYFIIIWLDMDVSDCCVGRFETDKSRDEVVAILKQDLDAFSQENQREDAVELPLERLKGWLTF